MQNFTTKIVNMMKSEQLYASQGGPIILSQIENEYEKLEEEYHEKGAAYVRWAAAMAVGLQTGVPWTMCKQDDAPDSIINTCNGRKCGQTFKGPNSPNKPALWSENWTSRYEVYGENVQMRAAEDIAFHVALFIAKNGSFVNYYMYHGGTNFGRTAAAFVLASYYDQAPLDEYGLIRQPKYTHLEELHAAIKLCSKPLLYGAQVNHSLGEQQEAYIFYGQSGECAAFLVNNDKNHGSLVSFQNSSYDLPPESISILPDCRIVAFNTAKVSAQYGGRSMVLSKKFNSIETWEEFEEVIPNFYDTALRSDTLLDQMSTTNDTSDYLWYTFSFQQESPDAQSLLNVDSLGHVLHAFINGTLVGSAHGTHEHTNFSMANTIPLNSGTNNISLLSAMVGLPDSGSHLESRTAGLHRVTIESKEGIKDFTNYSWGYQVGLFGEKLQIYDYPGVSNVQWSNFSSAQNPLTWYKTIFDEPPGNDPVVLNLGSMRKGEAWINGESIGRYWLSYLKPDGSPSQTWYNVPRSFLNPSGNLLVLLEEESGFPLGISLATVQITNVCGHVSESHPPAVASWHTHNETAKKYDMQNGTSPKVQLTCPHKKSISKILFASFGTPAGDCGTYAIGACHSSNSRAAVEKACLGKRTCSIPLSNHKFGSDPCPGVPKALLVHAQCT